ncbi:hypothetical protein N9B48_02790 [bacterium]|nr:hypothetical protein [bacterium]
MTPSGNQPIPGRGTRVRVYLNGEKPNWSAALPNGITPPDANDDESVWQDGRLTDATEIRELRSLLYTYVLPLEVWAILVLVVAPTTIVATVFIRRLKRRKTEVPHATEQTDEPEPE